MTGGPRLEALVAIAGRVLNAARRAVERLQASVGEILQPWGERLLRVPVPRVILFGLVVRLALAPFTSWTHDMYPFYRAVMDMLGGLDPYETSFFTYPPLWAYVLFPLFLLAGSFLNPLEMAVPAPSMALIGDLTEMLVPAITSPAFNLMVKLPLIVADLALALLLLRWTPDLMGERGSRAAFLLWFLNPLVIWVNAAHGQFDTIPAFLTLAAGLLLLRGRHVHAGLALGMAILFKLYPVFLLLPFLLLLLAVERSREGSSLRGSLRAAVLFLAGASISLLFLGLPLLTTRFMEVVIVRRAQFAVFGGFNPFFFLALDIWEELPLARVFLLPLPMLASPYLLVLPIAVSLLAGKALLRRSEASGGLDVMRSLCLMTVLPLVALYSALVLVNPQHLLWILPFLAMAAARWRSLLAPTLVVSLAGLLFFLALQGPAAFLYPAAAYTPLLEVEGLNGQILAYWSVPGVLSGRIQEDILFLVSGTGYLFLLLAAREIWKVWKGRPSPQSTPRPPSRPAMAPANPTVLPVAALLLLIAVQGIVLSDAVPASGALQAVTYSPGSGSLRVVLRGHSLYEAQYRVTTVSLEEAPPRLPLYLYYDEAYPVSNTSRPRVLGILDHLTSELDLLGMPGGVTVVGAYELFEILRGPPAVLIVATTALPDLIYLSHPNLLREWVRAGGVLIWTGALLGAYVGTSYGRVVDMSRYAPEIWGPPFVLGFDPVGGEGLARASVPSRWSRALDIRFPLTSWGARAQEVEAAGGLVLGPLSPDGRTSLALIPLGEGAVALFGNATGPTFTYSAEDVLAHDIARLLASGLLANPHVERAVLLNTTSVLVPAGREVEVSLAVEVPEDAALVRVLIFSQVDFDSLVALADLPP